LRAGLHKLPQEARLWSRFTHEYDAVKGNSHFTQHPPRQYFYVCRATFLTTCSHTQFELLPCLKLRPMLSLEQSVFGQIHWSFPHCGISLTYVLHPPGHPLKGNSLAVPSTAFFERIATNFTASISWCFASAFVAMSQKSQHIQQHLNTKDSP